MESFERKSRWSKEEKSVRKLLNHIKEHDFVYSTGPAGMEELETTREVVESLSKNYSDLYENLECFHELFHKVDIEPKEGFFPPGKSGKHKSSNFSLHLDEEDLLDVLSKLLPKIRQTKKEHGSFHLGNYLQIDSDKEVDLGERLFIGEARYFEDDKHYMKRVEEYAKHYGYNINVLKRVPRKPYQASRKVYEVYLENLPPLSEYFYVFAEVLPPD
jgi:hypothetical protein